MEPPFRFAFVEQDVFRGAYPKQRNYSYLKRLQLTTLLSLTPDPPLSELVQFCIENTIQSVHIRVEKPKETIPLTYSKVATILQFMIEPAHHPMYIHCLDGTLITGLMVACLRKLQLWSVSSCLSEYSRCFAEGLVGSEEAEFVEKFQADIEVPAKLPSWLWGGQVYFKKHPSCKLKPSVLVNMAPSTATPTLPQSSHSASTTQLPPASSFSHYSSASTSRRLSTTDTQNPSVTESSPRTSVIEKQGPKESKRRPMVTSSDSSTPLVPSTRQGSLVGLEGTLVARRPDLTRPPRPSDSLDRPIIPPSSRPSDSLDRSTPASHEPSLFDDEEDEEEEEEEVAENNMSLMLKALALEFSHYRPPR